MVRFLADAHSFAADLADIDGFAPSEAIACARVIPHSALRLSADEIIPDAVPAAARGALTCEPKADHSAPMQIFQTNPPARNSPNLYDLQTKISWRTHSCMPPRDSFRRPPESSPAPGLDRWRLRRQSRQGTHNEIGLSAVGQLS